MRPAVEFILGTRSSGDGRRGATVVAAALALLGAAMVGSPSVYAAPEALKVGAGIRSGQLSVLGTVNGLGGDDKVTIGRAATALIRTLVDLGGDE